MRRSRIWKISAEEFETLVKNSNTYTEVLRFFNMENKGGNIYTLKGRISEEGIDDSHIKNYVQNLNHLKTRSDDDVFSLNSGYCNSSLKKRLIKNELIDYKCNICKLEGEWEGKDLSLQMDHINGNSKDHRLENLRFLCPNCHSQTPTFAGKKKRKPRVSDDPNWNKKDRPNKRKVVRPTKEELENLITDNSWCAIGRMFGVSDNAVRKWAKRYEIPR